MPIGIDDVLLAAAAAAGKELGTELADDLFNAIFGSLATKDDLDRAVAKIEAFVHQELDELKTDIVTTDITSGISALKDFAKTRDKTFLESAYNNLTAARSWIDRQREHNDDDFLRLQYSWIVAYAVYDISLWTTRTFHIKFDGNADLLCGRIDDHILLLQSTLKQIKVMETESITTPHCEIRMDDYIPDPDSPHLPFTYHTYGWYDMFRGTYPNGKNTIERIIYGADKGQVLEQITPLYNSDVKRIATENQERVDLVYSPVNQFIQSMINLKDRIQHRRWRPLEAKAR